MVLPVPNTFSSRLRRQFRQFIWGGEWAVSLPEDVKHNLYWFFFDGFFATAGDNIYYTYLVIYVLALGATSQQIGWMSSVTSLVAALVLLPGALLVEKIGRRKEIVVISGGLLTRLMFPILAILPFIAKGQGLIWAAILCSVLHDAGANLAFPAWIAMTGEMVPVEGRGRYFGSRNVIYGIIGMVIIYLAGELITGMGSPGGYQVAFMAAFLIGSAATYSFWRLRDPHTSQVSKVEAPISLAGALRDIKAHPGFIVLCLVMALWNFSLNIAGPFFNVRMVNDLKFTASMIGVLTIISTVSNLLVQRKMGELADRIGPRRVQMICMLFIPFLTISWVIIAHYWQVVVVNIFSGVLWGVFGLVSFNLLLDLTPDAQRARYSAIYQIVMLVALAIGAAFGSWVISRWGYPGVFTCSAIGRMLAAILFALFVPTAEGLARRNASA
jgi:MFS family permease